MQRLKFKLDRKSLELIYTTFIRPFMEYSEFIWDNCTRYEKQEKDQKNEVARDSSFEYPQHMFWLSI